MDFEPVITSIYEEVKKLQNKGRLPDYIPELARVSADKFGICLTSVEGNCIGRGDYQEKFSVQSIAKVFSLMLAYKHAGEAIRERVGVEPSGSAFNSLIQLETDRGVPRNPFINAGALVICDCLISYFDRPDEVLLRFVRQLCGLPDLNYSEKVTQSEKAVGYRNVAMCNFMKSFGTVKNDPSQVLDFYFRLCSLEMSCEELSKAALVLANGGRTGVQDEEILTKSQCKRMNALMQTCGFYDESGDFAFKVGLPGKSGVGGGIIAVHPGKYSLAVWSPMLNKKGNSYKGLAFLERFTTQTALSIF